MSCFSTGGWQQDPLFKVKTSEEFFLRLHVFPPPFVNLLQVWLFERPNLQKQNLSPSWTEQIYAKAKEVAVVGSDIAAAAFVNVFSGWVKFKHPLQKIGVRHCPRRRLSSRHSLLAFKPLDLCINLKKKFTQKFVQYVDRKSGSVISITASAILAQRGLALVNRSKTETKEK